MSIITIVLYIAVLIVFAFLLNLGSWWAALRLFDGRKISLRFERFVAVRHLRGGKSGVTVIGVLAVLGVSVSSCTLTTVLSVMGGFSGDLKGKIFKTNSHVLVDNFGNDMNNWEPVLRDVETIDGVIAATPILHRDMMMTAPSNNTAIKFMGIDLDSFQKVSGVLETLDKGDVEYIKDPHKLFKKIRDKREKRYGLDKTVVEKPSPAVSPRQKVLPTVIVGREISRGLRLYEGMEVNIINPVGGIGPTGPVPRSRPFRVGGVFFSGMYEFDKLFVYTSLDSAQKYLNKPGYITEIQVAVDDPSEAQEVTRAVAAKLGDKLRVRSWADINAPLFSALKIEKIVMSIILSLATLVASFCIVATLTMLVLQKGAEVSTMMTLGASPKDVRSIFRFEGLLIGVVGTTSGLVVGFCLCTFLQKVGLPIDPEVWYIDKLPVTMEWLEFLLVGVASMTITQVATLFPAQIAAKLTPVEGLKND